MALKIALAQMIPAWLNREETLSRVTARVKEAAAQGAQLAAFGEALVPGYPFWPELTDGAVFESDIQKDIFAHYAANAVDIEGGDLDSLCAKAGELGIAVYLGTIEKTKDRGGFSLYATLVYIAPDGKIGSAHRKLMPTYDERLVWSPGDGNGLRVHDLGEFRVGGLLGELDAAAAGGALRAGRKSACGGLARKLSQHRRHHPVYRQGVPLLRGVGQRHDACRSGSR